MLDRTYAAASSRLGSETTLSFVADGADGDFLALAGAGVGLGALSVDGQVAAMPEIPLRDPVPRGALFATDTSGGFFDALENFRRVNSGMELFFEAEKVLALEILHCGNPDPMLFLIGGVGEYELVYAMPRGMTLHGIKIGEGEFGPGKDNWFRWSWNGQNGIMKSPPPDYRNILPEQWFSATADYLKEMMT